MRLLRSPDAIRGSPSHSQQAPDFIRATGLRAGRSLRIPNNGDALPPTVAESVVAENAGTHSSPRKAKSATARIHKVKAGQTLSGIAARYQVSTAALIRHNDLPRSGQIQTGMRLKIPG